MSTIQKTKFLKTDNIQVLYASIENIREKTTWFLNYKPAFMRT